VGWRIYRIWSTDWFADPEREMRRLLAWIEEKRAAFAEDYTRRPKPARASEADGDDGPDRGPGDGAAAVPGLAPPIPSPASLPSTAPPARAAAGERTRPEGEPLRSLGDFDWFQISKGYLYEVWLGDRFGGEVEVLSRATAAPRLYGNQALVARSEYEGRVEATGEHFKTNDLYAAVREVARRSQLVLGPAEM
jgi:hypothetical protein